MGKRQHTVTPDGYLACTKCKEVKPDKAFPRNKNVPYRRGRHQWCLKCNGQLEKKLLEDPLKWRRRRDQQAMYARRQRGKAPKMGPVFPQTTWESYAKRRGLLADSDSRSGTYNSLHGVGARPSTEAAG